MQRLGVRKQINSLTFNFEAIEFNLENEIELTIDLGQLIMRNQTNESFDDLLKQLTPKNDNLFILSRLRLMLQEEGILTIINQYTGPIENSYMARMEILLNKAGFIDIEIISSSIPLTVKAKKRILERVDIGYGLVLREVIHPDEILLCHKYAKDYYFYKDFNYDLNVVKKFDLNCDHFAVFDDNNEIYSMARIIIRTPGHYCPFMYARIANGNNIEHISVPGKDKRIGEVMAVYSAGKKGVVSFKRMMEYLTQYGTTIGHFDSVWTTYDDDDIYTGTYYKNKFKMNETGIKLKYSDFGGIWNLLVTDQISTLKDLHHQIFKQK
ncbi:MAG: hypothetical protein KAQ93_02015 [Spirochaetales bacterium]|nr:hypothetical protein [Spirochaetales bacterium]